MQKVNANVIPQPNNDIIKTILILPEQDLFLIETGIYPTCFNTTMLDQLKSS